jgi:hypothetical protein
MHKVQHKPINIQVRDPIQKEQKGLECVVVWRTGLYGAPGPYRVQPATLGKTRARSAIIHRIVRCATELSGESAGNGYPALTVDSAKCYSAWIVRGRSQSRKSEGHQTVRCRKKTKPQWSTELQNHNSWVTWWHTRQPTVPVRWRTGLSGAPIARSLPNDYFGGWGL